MSNPTYKLDEITKNHAEALQRYFENERLKAIAEMFGDGTSKPIETVQTLVVVEEKESDEQKQD